MIHTVSHDHLIHTCLLANHLGSGDDGEERTKKTRQENRSERMLEISSPSTPCLRKQNAWNGSRCSFPPDSIHGFSRTIPIARRTPITCFGITSESGKPNHSREIDSQEVRNTPERLRRMHLIYPPYSQSDSIVSRLCGSGRDDISLFRRAGGAI